MVEHFEPDPSRIAGGVLESMRILHIPLGGSVVIGATALHLQRYGGESMHTDVFVSPDIYDSYFQVSEEEQVPYDRFDNPDDQVLSYPISAEPVPRRLEVDAISNEMMILRKGMIQNIRDLHVLKAWVADSPLDGAVTLDSLKPSSERISGIWVPPPEVSIGWLLARRYPQDETMTRRALVRLSILNSAAAEKLIPIADEAWPNSER
jgi:hypothetical protein